MPVIKIKHVVSFSSEDKVHKAENILKSETYRKWKCANTGEKNASIILQFEKATKIHAIDIGNESSAFVEVLVGRSSDAVNDFQVLLVSSSFMSPIESRNETHNNRVRMFGADKLAQNLKDEKWDCVQIICSQPFNKNISYGLTFIKFHSPPEKTGEQPVESEAKSTTAKLGAFKIAYEEEDDSLPSVGSLFQKKNKNTSTPPAKSRSEEPSYAAAVLASSTSPKLSSQIPTKRKHDDSDIDVDKPRAKKEPLSVRVNKEKVGYTDVLGPRKLDEPKTSNSNNEKFGLNSSNLQSPSTSSKDKNKPNTKKVEVASVLAKEKTGTTSSKAPFHRIMKGVVFVISGFVNPLRGEIRDKAMEMGAKYKGDWDTTCTHLICAFVNTPKYIQVQGQNGKIITKDWIIDCYKKRTLLPWRKYMLGRYARDSSESSESEEEIQIKPTPKTKKTLVNGSPKSRDSGNVSKIDAKPSKGTPDFNDNSFEVPNNDSETEDEETLRDYIADTDVESDSGGDTEDEIRKVESKAKQKALQSPKKNKEIMEEVVSDDDDDVSLLETRPDTADMPLPELPNLFKSRHFYLYGDFTTSKQQTLRRYITAYNGKLEDYMSDAVKYVITESKWDKNFDEALAENEDLIFVKSEWILKCHENGKLIPYQPYIIIPNS